MKKGKKLPIFSDMLKKLIEGRKEKCTKGDKPKITLRGVSQPFRNLRKPRG